MNVFGNDEFIFCYKRSGVLSVKKLIMGISDELEWESEQALWLENQLQTGPKTLKELKDLYKETYGDDTFQINDYDFVRKIGGLWELIPFGEREHDNVSRVRQLGNDFIVNLCNMGGLYEMTALVFSQILDHICKKYAIPEPFTVQIMVSNRICSVQLEFSGTTDSVLNEFASFVDQEITGSSYGVPACIKPYKLVFKNSKVACLNEKTEKRSGTMTNFTDI